MTLEHYPVPESLVRRFWKYANRGSENECWIWSASLGDVGYGQIHAVERTGGSLRAHRVSWMINKGPIPSGAYVLHTCDNKACVNPNHLFLGDHRMNMEDMCQKGRHRGPIGEVVFTAKLNPEKVREIRRRFDEANGRHGMKAQLAREYFMTRGVIGLIVKRKIWKHVAG